MEKSVESNTNQTAADSPTDLEELLKHHCMMGVYEHETVDEATGISCPYPLGMFKVERPHATFRVPAILFPKTDPFPRIENVTMDPKDVLICSSPKTGTHYCFEILNMLLRGDAKHIHIPYTSRWIDVAEFGHILDTYPSKPRALSTHLPISCLPPNFRHKDTKIVVPMRNLKDVFVSFYHHMNGQAPEHQKKTWDEYFHYQLHSKSAMYWGPLDWYADLWDGHRQDPNILIVFYEDLIADPTASIKNIADHIEVVCSHEFIRDVANASCFKSMKKSTFKDEELIRKRFGDGFSLYRKGKVGDWKSWFTVAQNEEFHKFFDQWNSERQIPFVYE